MLTIREKKADEEDKQILLESFINSKFGKIQIFWTIKSGFPKIKSIGIGEGAGASKYMKDLHKDVLGKKEIEDFMYNLAALLKGWEIEFDPGILDFGECGSFQKRVLRVIREIPRGKVCSYKEIAIQLNSPKGARIVGGALSKNPFPLAIPCHRAVRSDGALGGYQGGADMKRALLELEGVGFDHRGRVILKDFLHEFSDN